jgi:hypothetical protein
MDRSEPIKVVAGIEVPSEERTPLVDQLLRVIEEQRAEIRALRDEMARLKGLPPRVFGGGLYAIRVGPQKGAAIYHGTSPLCLEKSLT